MTVLDHDYEQFPELTNQQINDIGFTSPHKQITEDFFCTVVEVTDGDTIRVKTDFRDFDFPVRFLDIDAPELSEGGEEAKKWLKQKIQGEEVQILINMSNRVGKYGRLLGNIFHNGISVAQEMLYLGLVSPFGQKKEGEVPDSNKIFRSNQWF